MTKINTESEYLSGDFCVEKNITEVIPLDEGAYQDGTYGLKLVFEKVQCNDTMRSIKKWSINKTSLKTVQQMYGDDTKNVVGKVLKIVCMPTQKGHLGIFVVLHHVPAPQTNLPQATEGFQPASALTPPAPTS